MIKELLLDNHKIKYQITFKNNKNTYFYFKSEGYIQINASRYQTHKDIFDYIKNNQKSFIRKFETIEKNNEIHSSNYYIFGNEFTKELDLHINKLQINFAENTIKEPKVSVDQLKLLYKNMEKEIILENLNNLKDKYYNNGIIYLKDVTFRTRYMITRFGSCNPRSKVININLYLVNMDKKYLEYVFLHEISHLVHQNHSPKFYSLLSKFSKDHRQLKKELNSKFNKR